MNGISIAGFGNIPSGAVVLRRSGQSCACKEKRAKLTIENDCSASIVFVRLDGGFYPNGDACDYSVSSQETQPVGFLLELKGRKMQDAVDQLEKTVGYLARDGITVRYRRAVVVSSGAKKIPSTAWLKLQKRFFSCTRILLGRYANQTTVAFGKVVAS